MTAKRPRLNGKPCTPFQHDQIRYARANNRLLSASQAESGEDCLRKVAWDKVVGVPRKGSRATLEGSQCHDALEKYLLTGKLDLADYTTKIITPGLKYNPAPGTPHMLVEQHFYFTYRGYWFQGYKDVEILTPGCLPYEQDHKTTGNFRWAKDEHQLRDNLQACLYGADGMAAADTWKASMQWVYYRRTGAPKARSVSFILTAAQAKRTLDASVRTFAAIDYIKVNRVHPLHIPPPHPDVCGKYGGCQYKEHCTDIKPDLEKLANLRLKETKP